MSFHLSWHILVGRERVPRFFVQFKGRSTVFSVGKVKGVPRRSPPGRIPVLGRLLLTVPRRGQVVVILALRGPLVTASRRGAIPVPAPVVVLRCAGVAIVTGVISVKRGALTAVH